MWLTKSTRRMDVSLPLCSATSCSSSAILSSVCSIVWPRFSLRDMLSKVAFTACHCRYCGDVQRSVTRSMRKRKASSSLDCECTMTAVEPE
jgi:hypothetical protein